jgi:hypothetical protein
MKHKTTLLAKNFKNTFLSCEKDQETIWRKLFIESKPYSDKLKRLLVVNTKDCLDESQYQYKTQIDKMTIKELRDKQYIKVTPKLSFGGHEEVKAYILLEFDDFTPTENPAYRDCAISFTIICHLDYWELDDYKLRPHQIAGYIDGILNDTKLSGIGTLQFMGATQVVLNEELGGLIVRYVATHNFANGDDAETINPEWPAPQD